MMTDFLYKELIDQQNTQIMKKIKLYFYLKKNNAAGLSAGVPLCLQM